LIAEMMKRILVIEDREETRNLFLKSLKAKGFQTISAENGLVGIQRAKQQLPDLIVCEIMMSQLDGYDVLTTLHQEPDTAIIPFIFITAKETRVDLRKGMELGADDCLAKPCTVDELIRAISARLAKQAVLRQWLAASQLTSEPPASDTAIVAASQPSFPSVPQLSEVFDFIEANYHKPIDLSDVAKAVGYSPAYLTDLVRRQTGQTVHRWIVSRRMAKACSLLLETNQTVEQITEAVGYRYAGCFFRQFRQSFGMTPQAWRSAQRTQGSTH